MQLPNPQPDNLATLAHELKSLAADLVSGLNAAGAALNFYGGDELLNLPANDHFYLVKTGQVLCKQREKMVYFAEAGDLIGLFQNRNLPDSQYECEDFVELIPYHFADLQRQSESNSKLQQKFVFYLVGLSCYFSQALAHEIPKQFKPATGFLQFEEGDVIINQGEQAECVYTLLEGTAVVTHDGIKVGEIKTDETFGAMALFTKQPRNATVTATSSCSVLAVRKDEFMDLVSHQPHVCMGLIEEMADKINQLNRQVYSLQQ